MQNSLRGQPEFLLPSLPPKLPLWRLLESPFQRCLQIPVYSTRSTACTVCKPVLTQTSPCPTSGHQTQPVIVQRDFSSLVDKEVKFSMREWPSGQCVPLCQGTQTLITHSSDSGRQQCRSLTQETKNKELFIFNSDQDVENVEKDHLLIFFHSFCCCQVIGTNK